MALAHGTVTTNNQTAAEGPHGPASFSHDNGGAGCLLVIVCANRDTAVATTFSCNYNSVAMTKVVEYQNVGAAETYTDGAAFILEGSWSGSLTINLVFDNTTTDVVDSWTIQAIPITGYKAGDLTGAVDATPWTGTANKSALTQGVTTTGDASWIVMLYCPRDPTNHGPVTVSGGGTKITESESAVEGNAGSLLCTAYLEVASALTADDITCTGSASDSMVGGSFELLAAVAGGATVVENISIIGA